MQAYQQRVITEKEQLEEKITKLDSFITGSDDFDSIEVDEQDRLRRQLAAMKDYSAVLGERIAVWPQDAGE